ncbi:MAG: hypothetical protein ACREDI_07855 [Roseiarcus sp.]
MAPYVMVNSFPSAVRFTGASFSYNLAWAVFGGLTSGRTVQRGLDDELKGSLCDVRRRTHHFRFSDLEFTGDAPGHHCRDTRL